MKKTFVIVAVLFCLMLGIVAATADQQWYKYGYDAANTQQLPLTGSISLPFSSNWTTMQTSQNQPLVADLDNNGVNEVIQVTSGTVRVFNGLTGIVDDQMTITGLGNRQPTIFASSHCGSGLGLYLLTQTEVHELCFNGALSDYQNTTIPSSAASQDLTGMAVYTYSGTQWGIFAANTSTDYVFRCRFDTMSCSATIFNGSRTMLGVPPQGNLNGDSIPDFVFIAPTDRVMMIDAAGTVTSFNHSGTGGAGQISTSLPVMIIKRSSGNDWIAYSFQNNNWQVTDRFGNREIDTFNCVFGGNDDVGIPVQQGAGGDVCVVGIHGSFGYTVSAMCCKDLNDVYTRQAQLCFENPNYAYTCQYTMKYMTSATMNYDTRSDFIGDFGISYALGSHLGICNATASSVNCGKLYPMIPTANRWTLPVDIDKDGARDLVAQRADGKMTVFLTNVSNPTPPTVGCSLPTCAYPCIFWDEFSYDCSFASMNWTLIPANNTIAPVGGQMCINPSPNGVHYSQRLLTQFADEQVVTDEFDMKVDTGVTPIHEFAWLDTDSSLYKSTYYLWWEYNGTNANLWVRTPVNGSWVANLLCSDCWQLGVQSHYKVTQYHQNTGGNVFYNTSSSLLEPVLSNSYSVEINNNLTISYFNLPNYQSLNHSHNNLINDVTWKWYNENVCLDSIKVYAGTVFGVGNFTTSCTYHPNSYEFPILWLDYFQYPDEITDFGWVGYPFRIGDNPYTTCDILYYDMDKYQGAINHSMSSAIYNDFEMSFDLQPDSSITPTTYDPCGAPMYFKAYDSSNNLVLFARFGQTTPDVDGYCNITSENQTEFYDIGKWDGGGMNSYKIDVYFDNKTWDFYYTTQANPYSYILGASGIGFWNTSATNIKKFSFEPITPQLTYQNGFWLDSIKVTQTEGVVPANQTNFCYFTGCIYHDHFDYDNSIDGHGWWLFNITPSQSYIVFSANPYGYDMTHNFDVFRNSDDDGIVTVQTKMLVRPMNVTAVNKPHFYVYSADYTKTPLNIYFQGGATGGNILDTSSVPFTTIGSYVADQWYTFTWVLDLNSNTYDFYIDSSKAAASVSIRDISVDIGKVGYHTINNEVWIDLITVARGNALVAGFTETLDTGINADDLKNCWITNKTSGITSFDWNCCTGTEKTEKSLWCMTKVQGRYALGSITSFVLTNFLYFIVLAIIFVLIMPFIVPGLRRG